MKIRIQRKRKPALAVQTRQLFALGSLLTGLLKLFAGGNSRRDALLVVQIENRAQDTRVKRERESLVIAQNQRLDLLNAKLKLELIDKYGDKYYEVTGETKPNGEFDDIPHTV